MSGIEFGAQTTGDLDAASTREWLVTDGLGGYAMGTVGGLLDGLFAHLREWGLGSISETTDGDAPYAATGCPFQAWSVAEVLRAKRNTDG